MNAARLAAAASLLSLCTWSLPALAQDTEGWEQPPARTALRPPVGEARDDDAAVTATTRTSAEAPVFVPTARTRAQLKPRTWSERARFFGGVRTGIGVPPGGEGVAPTAGLEIGVAADSGLGLGLHFLTVWNPPDAPSLNIPKAQWGIGAAADVRWYFQTVRPLTLYPTLSVGFLGGPSLTGRNAVLPMLNPGFGARVRVSSMYVSFEFGVVGFQVPFVNIAFGWEPNRAPPSEEDAEEG